MLQRVRHEVVRLVTIRNPCAFVPGLVVGEVGVLWYESQVEKVGTGQVFSSIHGIVDMFGDLFLGEGQNGVEVAQSFQLIPTELGGVKFLALIAFQHRLLDLLFFLVRIDFLVVIVLFILILPTRSEDLLRRTLSLLPLHPFFSKFTRVDRDLQHATTGGDEARKHRHQILRSNIVPVEVDHRYPICHFSHGDIGLLLIRELEFLRFTGLFILVFVVFVTRTVLRRR